MPADSRERKPEAVAVPHASARGLLLAEEVGISRPTHTRSLGTLRGKKHTLHTNAVPTSCGSGPQASQPLNQFGKPILCHSALECCRRPGFEATRPAAVFDRLLVSGSGA